MTEECRGAGTVINEHVSDDFKGEGITGMLKYMEHFTYVDSLVTGLTHFIHSVILATFLVH